MSQLMIDFKPVHNGTATSRAAARAIKPHAATLRAMVFGVIAAAGDRGMTRPEIEAYLQIKGDTVRPRVAELMAIGVVRKSDLRRETPSGRDAEVLVAVVAA